MLEFQKFNDMWDEQMGVYDERAGELLETMRQRHELDAREFKAKHAAAASSPRLTPKLLDLRRTEQALARRGEYAQAQRVKVEADELEAAEAGRAQTERSQHVLKLEAGLLQKQEAEVAALRQRIKTGAEEQKVARQHDLERLLKRYHNIKSELGSQQKAECARERKGLTRLPGALGGARAGSRALLMASQASSCSGSSPGSPGCSRPSPRPSSSSGGAAARCAPAAAATTAATGGSGGGSRRASSGSLPGGASARGAAPAAGEAAAPAPAQCHVAVSLA